MEVGVLQPLVSVNLKKSNINPTIFALTGKLLENCNCTSSMKGKSASRHSSRNTCLDGFVWEIKACSISINFFDDVTTSLIRHKYSFAKYSALYNPTSSTFINL